MNFIFDIGNVLINFRPKEFLHALHPEQSDANKMYEVIFQSSEWVQLDRGVISQEDATNLFCIREPEYKQLVIATMSRLEEMLTLIPETVELLTEIKAHGHKLYYLSNYHEKLRDYIKEQNSFFNLFDGGVFSCDIHEIKPFPEIYKHLLREYDLIPSECLFIDDVDENVKCAESLGMRAVVFTSAEETRKYISRWLGAKQEILQR